jgi:very-short-patch-repair endonuclease
MPGGKEQIEIGVPATRRVRRRELVVHELGGLERADVTVFDAIPVTTPTRTLIDLAAVVSADVLEEALDDALRRRLTTVRRLRWRLAQLGTRGRPGAGRLEKLVVARAGGTVTESVLETRFLRLLRRSGLSLPESQYEIRDGRRLVARVDFAYPDLKLVIEIDGYRWHSGRARWERDLARRNALTALGWRVIHVTSTDLDERPGEIVAMIAGALVGSDLTRA